MEKKKRDDQHLLLQVSRETTVPKKTLKDTFKNVKLHNWSLVWKQILERGNWSQHARLRFDYLTNI